MHDQNNIFAKIIREEIPSEKIYEDDTVIAMKDIAPAAPVHILVIPKGEYISFDDFMEKANEGEVSNFFKKVKKVANDLGLHKTGYRILANHGSDATQTVPHFHMHILGGKPLGSIL